MRRLLVPVVFLFCLGCRPGGKAAEASDSTDQFETSLSVPGDLPLGVQVILSAYPKCIESYSENKFIFRDGSVVEYDDGLEKSYTEMLDNCDVEDMFRQPYRRDSIPQYLSDVGRGRSEKLYKALFGSSAAEVRKNLVPVEWLGQRIMFTSVSGANLQLEKVAAELATHPEFREYLTGASTFYWRQVRGANRLSAHSYGIAVDINTGHSDYWLWAFGNVSEYDHIGYRNRIPAGIVDIFEKYGFIWGGSWYHFDTMHFEYRPELLMYAEKLK